MSPVSRGRKGKKSKKGGKKRAFPFDLVSHEHALDMARVSGVGQDEQLTRWHGPAARAVLDQGDAIVAARGPRQLEQAVCEVLGARMHQVLRDEHFGLVFDQWVQAVAVAAADRVVEASEQPGTGGWKAPWRLLHGLLSIAPPALAAVALDEVDRCADHLGALGDVPSWLAVMARVRATGRMWRLRDAYGLRGAVIAEYTYPLQGESSVFLFDYDMSELVDLVEPGAFGDLDEAVAAWRAAVGDAAEGSGVAPVEDPADLQALAQIGTGEALVRGDESRALCDNWFRARRRLHDLAVALADREVRMPEPADLFAEVEVADMCEEFDAWHQRAHGGVLDPALVTEVAEQWVEGSLPHVRHLVSPRRVAAQRAMIGDWGRQGRDLEDVCEVLVRWTRWLGERQGLPEHLVERAASAGLR